MVHGHFINFPHFQNPPHCCQREATDPGLQLYPYLSLHWCCSENWQPNIWLPLYSISGLLPMILELTFTFRSPSFEKNHITHMLLGAFHFMIVILVMPFVLSFYNLLGSFICPPYSFMQFLHKLCTGGGIHV